MKWGRVRDTVPEKEHNILWFLQKKIKMTGISGGTKGGVCVHRFKVDIIFAKYVNLTVFNISHVKIKPAGGDNILVKFEQFLKNT